jgi:hypothetical protein
MRRIDLAPLVSVTHMPSRSTDPVPVLTISTQSGKSPPSPFTAPLLLAMSSLIFSGAIRPLEHLLQLLRQAQSHGSGFRRNHVQPLAFRRELPAEPPRRRS